AARVPATSSATLRITTANESPKPHRRAQSYAATKQKPAESSRFTLFSWAGSSRLLLERQTPAVRATSCPYECRTRIQPDLEDRVRPRCHNPRRTNCEDTKRR